MAELSKGIALDKDRSVRVVPVLIAVMVYLAGLALIGATALAQMSASWTESLDGQVTIQIPASAETGPGEPPPPSLAAVLEQVKSTPGVIAAEALPVEDMHRLLEPWLGQGLDIKELPLPWLITVEFESADRETIASFEHRLAPQLPEGSVIEDHQRWIQDVLGLIRSLETAAVIVVALIGLSAIALIALVTRMSLASHRPVIELLHLMGAHDNYVARQFQAHGLRVGLIGGCGGFLAAAVTLLALDLLISRLEGHLFQALSSSILQWVSLALLPLCAALIAMVTARITVTRSLAQMP